jgi:parvulin-like peptidyl-prolyl isomerase
MRREYEEHPERYQSDKKVTVAVILLKPEDADKRDEVMKALKKSGFHDVAKKYSADSKAKDGGVWKDVKPSEAFRPEICAEIDRTPVGTISKWVPLDGWYFLLKKESESDSAPRSFKDAYDDIAANVKAAEAKRLYTEWMDRLKAETYIKIY